MIDPKIYVGPRRSMTDEFDVYVFTDKKPSEVDLSRVKLKYAELADRKRFAESRQEIRPKRKRIER